MLVKPDVYKSLVSDTYVIFGEAKVDDSAVAAQGESLLTRVSVSILRASAE